MRDYKEYVDMFVKGAKELAEAVSEKTKKTASTVKIELEIKKAEQELDKAYRALGRIMYQIENGSLNRNDAIVEAACNQVRVQEELIAKLQKDKEDVKKPADENVVDVEAAEVSEEEEKEENKETEQPQPEKDASGYFVLKFCPYCKVGNHPDATKCVSCGKEI
jgi:hypothetical protein